MIEFRSLAELQKSALLQRTFPNITNGFINELNLREIAHKIKHFEDNTTFSKYSVETIVKFLRGAYLGGSFEEEELEGLMDSQEYSQRFNRRKSKKLESKLLELGVYESWSEDELTYVVQLHKEGVQRREIFRKYNEQEEFSERSFNSISSQLDSLIKNGEISRQRIDWSGDVGFAALWLKQRYGTQGNFIADNTNSLDEFFYNGTKRLTKSKLHNFYKRESQN